MKLDIVQLFILASFVAAKSPYVARTTERVPFCSRARGGAASTSTGRVASSKAVVVNHNAGDYTAVGVIPSDVLDASAILSLPKELQPAFRREESCSVVIMKEHGATSFSTLPRDCDMLETLSMTCHVLVLFISNPEISLNPEIIQSILQGAKRRRRLAGHDKLKLLVVLAGTNEATIAEARQELVLNELDDIDPQDFDSFDLVTLNQLSSVWNNGNVIASHDAAAELIDEDGLAKLIETIYESLSKQSCKVELESLQEPKLCHKSKHVLLADVMEQIMSQAQPQLDALESKQEDVWLNEDTVPMLEFGSEANEILEHATNTLDAFEPSISHDLRIQVLLSLAAKLKTLYDQQLQSLREHYGQRYESVLDDSEKSQEDWTVAAQEVTDAFRAAALHAIPKQCQESQELIDADFSYVMELQGLIADMMEATAARESFAALAEDDEEEEMNQPCVAKWYQKLAARAAVLAINYLQGWMAWQAIQRAAAERDKNMPKFPLF